MEKNNKFLTELLDLEVSGKAAISAPTNWAETPLLNVETEIDEIVERLAPSLISQNGDNKVGVWWFLVGSPGNGKSAAVGSLVRTLRYKHGAEFKEPKEIGSEAREISQLDEHEIPYVVELFEKNNKYASALFAQDASVVPNPYDQDPNTATALIELLKAASEKGQSVVVCANRGVIEKALQRTEERKEPWYQALNAIQKKDESKSISFKDVGPGRLVFNEVKVEVTPLDEKSIIVDNTFGKLLDKATYNKAWSDCDGCKSNEYCPFKNNRDWLKTDTGRSRFIQVLRYAELMSGQAIVFREAVAFISLMLAGTSRDYKEDLTPCDWVHATVKKEAFFSLLSRRIYMLLFKSQSLCGLKRDQKDRENQIKILTENADKLPDLSANAIKALKKPNISAEVGLTRFLSLEGVFTEIDPVKENQGKALEQRWNVATGNAESLMHNQPLMSNLEKRCFTIWADCENLPDEIENQDISHNYYRELRRWITSVTYRLGFFAEGHLLFQKELEEYQQILAIDGNNDLTDADEDLKERIEDSFKDFVFGSENSEVKISQVLTVYGKDVSEQLDPELNLSVGRKTRLIMTIAENPLELSPRSFAWLARKSRTGLSDKTFPSSVQQVANDIRYKAASYIKYAFIEKRIKLQIIKADESIIDLERRNNKLRVLRDGQ